MFLNRRSLFIWLLFFSLMFVFQLAETAAFALFLAKLGSHTLPKLFIYKALIDIPVAYFYILGTAKGGRRHYLVEVLILLASTLLAIPFLFGVDSLSIVFLTYLVVTALGTLLTVEWGAYVVKLFDQREMERAIPRVYTAARLGSACAGGVLGSLVQWVSVSDVLIINGALAGLLGVVILFIRTHENKNTKVSDYDYLKNNKVTPYSILKELVTNKLFLAIGIATLLFGCLRKFLYFQHSFVFEQIFQDEQSVAVFLGIYSLVANVVAVVLQLFVVPTLLRVMGLARANLLYAVLLSFSAFFISAVPSLFSSVNAKFFENEGKHALKTPFSVMFYNVMDKFERRKARATVIGIISPIGSIFSGILLYFLIGLQDGHFIVACICVVLGALYIVAAVNQGREYNKRSAKQEAQNDGQ